MVTHEHKYFSLEIAQAYFAQLNPIAQKIAQDICVTKLSYGHLWHSLKPTEHTDIINETLIKPEISLRYSDKCSSQSTISYDSSKGINGSSDSLTAVLIQQKNDISSAKDILQNVQNAILTKSNQTNSSSQAYGYDKHNLATFAMQQIALKIVHDDVLGVHRDEHSSPFSYKTKSQITLDVLDNETDEKDVRVLLFSLASSDSSIPTNIIPKIQQSDYKKLQKELLNNIKGNTKLCNTSSINTYEQFGKLSDQNFNTTQYPLKQIYADQMCTSITTKKEPNKTNINCFNSTSPAASYAFISDTCYYSGETTNLTKNCRKFGVLFASPFTKNTASEDDHTDYDDKTPNEEHNLLNNELSLRKGFDFLNNW